MERKIVLGLGGPQMKPSKGLYSWDDTHEGRVALFDTPNLSNDICGHCYEDREKEYFLSTPRAILCHNQDLFILSRRGIAQVTPHKVNPISVLSSEGVPGLTTIAQGPYDFRFFSRDGHFEPRVVQNGISPDYRADFLLSNEQVRAQMSVINTNLIVSWWLSDIEQWTRFFQEKPAAISEGKGGYIFVAPDMNLQSAFPIAVSRPCGPFAGRGDVIYSSGDNFVQGVHLLQQGADVKERFNDGGTVLSMYANNRVILSTDDQGTFTVRSKDGTFWRSPNKSPLSFGMPERMTALPSEATACTIARYEGVDYALLGLDEAKLRVYKLNGIQPEYVKTISLASLHQRLGEYDKDDHITHLKFDNSWVHLTMRNRYMRWGIQALLDVDPEACMSDVHHKRLNDSSRMSEAERKEVRIEYLHTLQNTFRMDALVEVPHRITSFDIWKY